MCTQYRDLVVSLDLRNGVRSIRINVPRRKNAIRLDTYREVQLDFTTEMEVFYMLFVRYHSKSRKRSIKQHLHIIL